MKRLSFALSALTILLLASSCDSRSHLIGPPVQPRFTYARVDDGHSWTGALYVAYDSVTGAEFLVSSQGGICLIPPASDHP